MKILVFSDSHGDRRNIMNVLEKHKNIDTVIHLGDGESEIDLMRELYPDKIFYNVAGNCDFGSDSSYEKIFDINNKKFFITHGHIYDVKRSLSRLTVKGKSVGADIVLYGHTHLQHSDYIDGMYILNPGSIRGYYGTYAIIEIVNNDIFINLISLIS